MGTARGRPKVRGGRGLKANIYATPGTWPFTMAGDPDKCRPCAIPISLFPAGRETAQGQPEGEGHLVARTLFRGPWVAEVLGRGHKQLDNFA